VSYRRSARAFDAALLVCLLIVTPVLAQERPPEVHRSASPALQQPAPAPSPTPTNAAPSSGGMLQAPALQQPSPMPMPAPLQKPPEVQKEIEVPQFDSSHKRDVPPPGYFDKFLNYDPEKGTVTQGRTQKDVDLEDFYRMVDRPDYVKKVKEKKAKRDWILAGAGVLAAAGITTGFILMFQPVTPTDCGGYYGCQYDNTQHVGVGLPIILGSLFAGGFIAGWALNMPLDPTSREESKQLADDYNTRLRAGGNPPAETEPRASLHILPFGTRGGGGLALGGRF
jgi:hypothetical protein